MKILMIISEAPPIKSGIARVAEQLSSGIRKRGHVMDILSIQDIPRYELGEIRLSSMPVKIREMRERIRDYDVIHLHGPVPTFSDVFLLMGLQGLGKDRPALVYTHHAPIDLPHFAVRPLTNIYNLTQELLARLADHVVVSTPSYRKRLSRFVPSEKLSIVPWGVDYEKYYSPIQRNGRFTVVYFGQIRPYKGLPVLLNAVDGIEDTRLWVIGNGHSAEKYQQLAANLDLKDYKFWGHVPDEKAIELLQKAHALVLPSITRSEAFGIVLLEGMAAGLVPVASHLPGVADVVGSEGLTFPAGDSKALQSILKRLRDETAYRQHLAGLAQAKVALYSWERVVYGYERIYRNLLKEQGSLNVRSHREVPTQPIFESIRRSSSGND
jgi:glycosyltransferase involved in cell wall biosynthesis